MIVLNIYWKLKKWEETPQADIKTICLDAQKSGFAVSNQLQQIRGFSVQIEKIYLSWEELALIENVELKETHLQDAKDCLLIGCYIGQRAGD